MNAPERAVELERSRFIGGSDVAGILGVSPFDTPLDVYLEKIGQAPPITDPAKLRVLRRGKLLEPIAIKMLRDDYGLTITKRSTRTRPNRYADRALPFLAAEIDFEWRVTKRALELLPFPVDPKLIGTVQNGEVKTCHVFSAWKYGDEGTDEVPIEYAAQAMHGLGITGRQLTLFGVLVGADNLIIYGIRRDEELIASMRPRLAKFWHEHVLAGVPPAPMNLPDVLKLFRKAEPIKVTATPAVLARYADFERAKDEARAAAEAVEAAKFDLGKFMLGEAAIQRARKKGGTLDDVKPAAEAKPGQHLLVDAAGAPVLEVNLLQATRIDADKVREDFPDVAQQCAKTSTFFKFERPRKPRTGANSRRA